MQIMEGHFGCYKVLRSFLFDRYWAEARLLRPDDSLLGKCKVCGCRPEKLSLG